MATRSITFLEYRVKKRHARKPEIFYPPSDVPPFKPSEPGQSLLDVAHHALEERLGKERPSTSGEAYTKVKRLEIVRADTLLVRVGAGEVGDGDEITDRRSNEVIMSLEETHGHELGARCLLWVPARAEAALMAIEHVRRRSAGAVVIDWIREGVAEAWPHTTLVEERVVRGDEWFRTAELSEVRVTRRHHSSDPFEDNAPKQYARLRMEFVPDGGRFTRRFRDELLEGSLAPSTLLGVPLEDDDEVVVKMDQGGETKSFVLGKYRTPTVRLALPDQAGMHDRGHRAFVDFALQEMASRLHA